MKLIISHILLFVISTSFAQEVLYQRPERDISLIVASNQTHTYRLNINSYAISISKFDNEMAFEDLIAVYPEDEFYFKEGKRRLELNNFTGFSDMVISQNYLHLIFESTSERKAKLYLFDLKIDLETFEAVQEMDLIYQVKAKRKADLLQASGFGLPYISYSDSLIKGIFQKPNKFKDDFTFGLIKLKIADKIDLIKESEVKLMAGIKRDFFDLKDFDIDEDDNMICMGNKVAQDNYRDQLDMFFFRPSTQDHFSKLNTNLDNREIEDYEMFIENGTPVIFGLCKKTVSSKKNSKNTSYFSNTEKDDENLESFALIYKNNDFQYPKIKYFENQKKTIEDNDYYRTLRTITSIGDEFYLVFQYLYRQKSGTAASSSGSYFSFSSVTTTHVRDFEIHKLDDDLDIVWENLIPFKAKYNNPDFGTFTRCNLIFKNKDEMIVLYNDSYENSKKELTDELNVLDLSKKSTKLPENKTIDRNKKIEEEHTDKDLPAYTLSFVSVNRSNGEMSKLDYGQRKLYSLVFNGTIKGYRNNKVMYIPYYLNGLFGICSIDKNNL